MLQINDKNGNDMLILKAFAIAYCKTNNIPTLHSTPKAKENRHNRNNSKKWIMNIFLLLTPLDFNKP